MLRDNRKFNLIHYHDGLLSQRRQDCSLSSEEDVTVQDFTNDSRSVSSRARLVYAVYLTAIGVTTVGWVGLLVWGVAALLFN
jgi:hypothetical protein